MEQWKIRIHVTYSVSKQGLYQRTRKQACVVTRLYGSPFANFRHTFLFLYLCRWIFANEDSILTSDVCRLTCTSEEKSMAFRNPHSQLRNKLDQAMISAM